MGKAPTCPNPPLKECGIQCRPHIRSFIRAPSLIRIWCTLWWGPTPAGQSYFKTVIIFTFKTVSWWWPQYCESILYWSSWLFRSICWSGQVQYIVVWRILHINWEWSVYVQCSFDRSTAMSSFRPDLARWGILGRSWTDGHSIQHPMIPNYLFPHTVQYISVLRRVDNPRLFPPGAPMHW